jgi:hypothetical protein
MASPRHTDLNRGTQLALENLVDRVKDLKKKYLNALDIDQ